MISVLLFFFFFVVEFKAKGNEEEMAADDGSTKASDYDSEQRQPVRRVVSLCLFPMRLDADKRRTDTKETRETKEMGEPRERRATMFEVVRLFCFLRKKRGNELYTGRLT